MFPQHLGRHLMNLRHHSKTTGIPGEEYPVSRKYHIPRRYSPKIQVGGADSSLGGIHGSPGTGTLGGTMGTISLRVGSAMNGRHHPVSQVDGRITTEAGAGGRSKTKVGVYGKAEVGNGPDGDDHAIDVQHMRRSGD